MIMKGLVLAAGKGKRLNDVTSGGSKCLIEIERKPIVKYAVENLCGIDEITECIVVVGHRAEEVIEAVGENVNGKKITFCRQREQKGLINAMEAALPALGGEDFVMALGDELIRNNNLQEAVQSFADSHDMCKVGIIRTDDISFVKKTYTFRYNSSLKMVDFIEKPEHPYNSLMGTGNVIFSGESVKLLNEVPVNPIRGEKELVDLFNLIVKKNFSISSFVVGENYVNLNTKNDFEILNKEPVIV